MGRATRLLLWAHAESSFQSTPSVGRATRCADWDNRHHKISIHALRGEGDSAHLGFNIHIDRFQSTPSVGRATISSLMTKLLIRDFNPRPPWGGRQSTISHKCKEVQISIHALRGEGDGERSKRKRYQKHFNPRPPWGGRQASKCLKFYRMIISIHALRGEGDKRSIILGNL